MAGVYFGVGGRLELGWLAQQIAALPAASHWQALARVAMRDDLSALARELARSVLTSGNASAEPAPMIDAWQSERAAQLARCRQLQADLAPLQALDMPMLSVLLRELRALL